MSLNLILYPYKLYKLRKNQWQSPSELEKLQENKLKTLIHHAYYKVDYYRRMFERAGIKPEDIKNIKDIVKIPITTRQTLQALSKKESLAKDVDISRCLNLRTSGSTGMPLDIFLGAREIISRWLFYRTMFSENGCKFTDKIVTITGPQNFRRTKKWFKYLPICQEKFISVFDETEKQLKVILEYKPQIIGSFASILKNLAIEIKKKKIKGIKPRLIFSTAELITKQDRGFISSVFQADVIDYYSCNECGIIAWECKEHFGYHIDIENVIVEFIKENGTAARAGEEGNIVITSLNSYTMPFIRYKLGDMSVPSDDQCPCGRTSPLIKKIIGRSEDYFILSNDTKIHPFFLMGTLESILGISQYQMIQQSKDKFKINIIKNDSFSFKTIVEIKENCKSILGNDAEVEINVVEKITDSGNGKFQAIKSEVSN